jgi:hypothetical protein
MIEKKRDVGISNFVDRSMQKMHQLVCRGNQRFLSLKRVLSFCKVKRSPLEEGIYVGLSWQPMP